MTRVAPVSLRFVRPEWATEVSSPPHDALAPADRRLHLERHPRSFLSVTRGPDDGEPGLPSSPRELLAQGRESLTVMLDDGIFGPVDAPGLYLYRLRNESHQQIGILCGVATDAYDAGMVRVHEQVRSDRASHLADHLEIVGVQSSPIAMAFRDDPDIDGLMSRIAGESEPMLSFQAEDGLWQDVFAVADEGDAGSILDALAGHPLYLIDGHHRAAAASMHQARRVATEEPSKGWMLSVLFPAGQLRNLAFHRVVHRIEADRMTRIEAALAERFDVRRTTDPHEVAHRNPTEIAMGRLDPDSPDGPPTWSLISLPFTGEEAANRLADLEPVRLNQSVLVPILDLDESEAGDALTYRPGLEDAEAIADLRPGIDELVFVMRPVPMSTLLAVADRGQVMPPKSTYFQPKVRSGVFIRHLDPQKRD